MNDYKIHFADMYGTATIECARENYSEVMKNLNEDPNVEDIWVESWDPEEGWQA